MTEPVRTCVGCRARAPRAELLRVVARSGALVPDPRGREPGRGAHLHPRDECLALARRRRAFPRALRVAGPLDDAALDAYVATTPHDRADHDGTGPSPRPEAQATP